MWNTLKSLWRCLDTLFWILTSLVLLYFLYTIGDGRFRFVFWQSTPAVQQNEQPEQPKDGIGD